MTTLRTQSRRLLALALLASVACFAKPATADDYALDESHAGITFRINHMGFSYTYGRFNKMAGGFSLDPADPTKTTFKLTIDASSIDTGNKGRDDHLRNADFLNTSEYPLISFESTSVKAAQADGKKMLMVTGNFTMHGVTKEVTLPIQLLGQGAGMRGEERAGFLCETKLKRSDYGMDKMLAGPDGKGGVGDEVDFAISFEGVKK
jgi:polyisoprenoid-binding protein YceI